MKKNKPRLTAREKRIALRATQIGLDNARKMFGISHDYIFEECAKAASRRGGKQ